MALVRFQMLGLLSTLLATSALGAAAHKGAEAAPKPAKKTKAEASVVTPRAAPVPFVAKSSTAEGVTLFEVAKPKSRPLIILAVKESEDFKSINLVMGLKTPEVSPPRQAPAQSPKPSQEVKGRPESTTPDAARPKTDPSASEKPTAQPEREKTVDELEAEKAENAAAEAAELPVDMGPAE